MPFGLKQALYPLSYPFLRKYPFLMKNHKQPQVTIRDMNTGYTIAGIVFLLVGGAIGVWGLLLLMNATAL